MKTPLVIQLAPGSFVPEPVVRERRPRRGARLGFRLVLPRRSRGL